MFELLEELVPLIGSAARPIHSLPPVLGTSKTSVLETNDPDGENGVENNDCFDKS